MYVMNRPRESATRWARIKSESNDCQALFVVRDESYGASKFWPYVVLGESDITHAGYAYEKHIVAVFRDGYSEF